MTENEANHGEESAEQCCQHEELEAVDDALVVQSPQLAHRWQDAALYADVIKHLPDHVAQEEEINSSGDGSQSDKSHLVAMEN